MSRSRAGTNGGWQAKYIFETDTLLSAMRTSVKAVAAKRPQLTRLTFCTLIPRRYSTGHGSEIGTSQV